MWALLSHPDQLAEVIGRPRADRPGDRGGARAGIRRSERRTRQTTRDTELARREAAARARSSPPCLPPPTVTSATGPTRTGSTSTAARARTWRSRPVRTSASARGSAGTRRATGFRMLFERLPNLRLDPERPTELSGAGSSGRPTTVPVLFEEAGVHHPETSELTQDYLRPAGPGPAEEPAAPSSTCSTRAPRRGASGSTRPPTR